MSLTTVTSLPIFFVCSFDPDPRIRHTVWTVTVGSTFLNLALYAVNQAQVQRYLSCKNIKNAKIAVMVNYAGIFVLNSLAVLCGVVMYGYYHNCDPLSQSGTKVKRADQLMPYLVLELFKHAPGMPGLFVAAVFSGSLSTVSTAITALASVTVQDFLKPYFNWSETSYTWISRGGFTAMFKKGSGFYHEISIILVQFIQYFLRRCGITTFAKKIGETESGA